MRANEEQFKSQRFGLSDIVLQINSNLCEGHL